ncbi:protein farnesyltransferase subunit beta-like [Watersipora subatra]|uniref:protein farnesyltransferase subunit beta-like n=1 Tax=Watersipora subatra TaxID=2589382 RepID=UPI00355BBC49
MAEEDQRLRCISPLRPTWQFDPEHVWTATTVDQTEVEDDVQGIYDIFQDSIAAESDGDTIPEQLKIRKRHLESFLMKGLTRLSGSYSCLDASRPWLCFWILHSLELLGVTIPSELQTQVPEFLAKCQSETGGFAGGPQQIAHLAPTYAAISALCIIGSDEAYKVINRETLYQFLLRMHQSDGSFIMHEGGEVDIRGCYLAANVARLTNIMTTELFDSTPQWIARCQTYEGGFGGVPGMEAHGGYAFCGIAALTLLGHEKLCDMDSLLRWTVNRQMKLEGGFQGRTNKLVDSCYSFWQSAIIPVISSLPEFQSQKWMFHNGALQEYVLLCCQHHNGGFIDKPGKSRDYYHTCYALSGLSISQNFTGSSSTKPFLVGPSDNQLVPVHPIYNLCIHSAVKASEYFQKLSPVTQGST